MYDLSPNFGGKNLGTLTWSEECAKWESDLLVLPELCDTVYS